MDLDVNSHKMVAGILQQRLKKKQKYVTGDQSNNYSTTITTKTATAEGCEWRKKRTPTFITKQTVMNIGTQTPKKCSKRNI